MWTLLSAVLRCTCTLIRWAVLFPAISVPPLACGAAVHRWGWPTGVWAAAAFLVILLIWRLVVPSSFRRWVSGRIRVRWRSWTFYRQSWASTCALHGLTTQLNDDVLVPQLKRIVIGGSVDVLTVRMLAGQSTTDWQQQAEALAHAFGAQLLRVRSGQPGWVEIEVQHSDPLACAVPLVDPAPSPGLGAVLVGVRENGAG